MAREIFDETLAAIDVPSAMHRKVRVERRRLVVGNRSFDLRGYQQARAIAIGKAAHTMLAGLRQALGSSLAIEGIVVAPTSPAERITGFQYFVAGHPVPNAASLEAARAILESLRRWDDQRTLLFFLLSGGGSALMELPLDPARKLPDIQQLYATLVTCGASIEEINTVRKHLSAVKGGRLALAAEKSTKITLAVSDVPPGKESALASGPTLPDPTTLTDFRQIAARHQLDRKLPSTLREWLAAGAQRETPKGHEPAFANAHFCLLLGMDDLFHPAHRAAEAKGFLTCCDNTTDDWPVERAAEYLLGQLADLRAANPGQRVALIADGELSSPLRGKGVGGRNSAFVLACVEKMAGQHIAALSGGTDGIDGNSPAAGAIADGESFARARELGLDVHGAALNSDAFTFFERLGDAVVTGPTGNNLRDLRILLAECSNG